MNNQINNLTLYKYIFNHYSFRISLFLFIFVFTNRCESYWIFVHKTLKSFKGRLPTLNSCDPYIVSVWMTFPFLFMRTLHNSNVQNLMVSHKVMLHFIVLHFLSDIRQLVLFHLNPSGYQQLKEMVRNFFKSAKIFYTITSF